MLHRYTCMLSVQPLPLKLSAVHLHGYYPCTRYDCGIFAPMHALLSRRRASVFGLSKDEP